MKFIHKLRTAQRNKKRQTQNLVSQESKFGSDSSKKEEESKRDLTPKKTERTHRQKDNKNGVLHEDFQPVDAQEDRR